jgi:DnaJ-class molecular chaperone
MPRPTKPKRDPFADDYRPYGTNDGPRGTPAQWKAAYEDRVSAKEAEAVLTGSSGTPYSILEILPGATLMDIKKAYRKLVMKVHPDHGGTDEAFKRVNAAYSLLMSEFD